VPDQRTTDQILDDLAKAAAIRVPVSRLVEDEIKGAIWDPIAHKYIYDSKKEKEDAS
jgi:hypothetical protein